MSKHVDEIGGRGLKIVQHARGVKASVDGLLLARYVRPEPFWQVADLGCGSGLVALIMASDQPQCSVVGVDIQAELLDNARQSVKVNGLDNVSLVRADLRAAPWPESLARFDLVAVNPPYREAGTGRISPDPLRAAARHEIFGGVRDFAAAAASLLRDGSSSTWIYLADRRDALLRAVEGAGMEPVRYRYVLSREGDDPSLILLEAILGGGMGACWEEPPLVLYRAREGREYTEEARALLYGE